MKIVLAIFVGLYITMVTVLLLTENAGAKGSKPGTKVVEVTSWNNGYREVKINGVTCIQFSSMGGYGGISCDWNKAPLSR